MIALLQKLCKIPRRAPDAPYTPEERAKLGAAAGGVGICTNILLSAAKFAIGSLSGSISVTADAANNLSDAGSSLLTLIGFRLSSKPADKEHPFGHARYEYLTGLAVSVLILLLGITFLKESVMGILNAHQSAFDALSLSVLGVSVAVKLWQSFFYRSAAKAIASESLKASAADSLNDAVMTSVVLLSALVRTFTGLEIDGFVGCGVAIFILVSGIKLVLETSSPLLGTAPDAELVHELQAKVLAYDGILGIHDLIVHSYGIGKHFATLHAEVDADADLLASHDLIDNIEENVGQALGIQLVIHLDPITLNDPKVNEMRDTIGNLIHGVSPELSFHDFRVVFGPTHTNVIFDLVVPTDFVLPDGELLSLITREIKDLYPFAIPKIKLDRDYSNFLE